LELHNTAQLSCLGVFTPQFPHLFQSPAELLCLSGNAQMTFLFQDKMVEHNLLIIPLTAVFISPLFIEQCDT
jgi:hypothetical protein